MFIKYKGTTSQLLTDLCRELNIPVDLKKSEEVLKDFFQTAMNNLSTEKCIQIISDLPPALKPFCGIRKPSVSLNGTQSPDSVSAIKTTKAVLTILEKYVQPGKLAKIYSCFPDNLFCDPSNSKQRPAFQHAA